MQSPFSDPDFSFELHDKAEKETPAAYSWPTLDENMMALCAAMAAFGVIVLVFSIARLETADFFVPILIVVAISAGVGFAWRRNDIRARNVRVAKRYWELKVDVRLFRDG